MAPRRRKSSMSISELDNLVDLHEKQMRNLEEEKKEKEISEKKELHTTMQVKINHFRHSSKRTNSNGEDLYSYIASGMNLETRQPVTLKFYDVPEMSVGSKYSVTVDNIELYNEEPQYIIGSVVDIIDPNDSRGLMKWLVKFCDGVGETTAKALEQRFGRGLYNILGNEEVLSTVEFLTPKVIAEITNKWNGDRQRNELYSYLIQFYNPDTKRPVFNKRQINSLIDSKGVLIKDIIKNNPWSLIKNTNGIGFVTADALAEASGADMNSPNRIDAAISYFIEKRVENDGHCCASIDNLVQMISNQNLFNINEKVVEDRLRQIASEEQDMESLDDDWFVIDEDNMVYRAEIYKAEKKFVDKIVKMMERGPRCSREDAQHLVNKVALREGLELDISQEEAAITSLMFPVVVMTGGPGVGKSTIQKVVMNCLIEMGLTLSACCPTGKGARRQEEASGFTATTIHRQLRYSAEEGGFIHNEENPLDASSIIVDEASMEDIILSWAQLSAVQDDGQIIYVGDVNQIPSVGAGQVLKDMIMSGLIPVCVLSKTHRQANESGIPIVAKRILEAEYPIKPGEKLRGVQVIELDDPNDLKTKVAEYAKYNIPMMGLSPDKDLMILAPIKEAPGGVNDLNQFVKHVINHPKHKESQSYGDKIFSVRDVVMHIKNNKNLKTNNGESGIIVGFHDVIVESEVKGEKKQNSFKMPVVNFDGRKVIYTPDSIDELVPANAGTYHKAQGSEQVVAVVACPDDATSRRMNTRNLLYTGFTRGKGDSIIIGTRSAIMAAVNNRGIDRVTGLQKKLKNQIPYIENLWNKKGWDTTFLQKNQEIIQQRIDKENEINNKRMNRNTIPTRKPKMLSRPRVKQIVRNVSPSDNEVTPVTVQSKIEKVTRPIITEKKSEENIMDDKDIIKQPITPNKHTLHSKEKEQDIKNETSTPIKIPRRPVRILKKAKTPDLS